MKNIKDIIGLWLSWKPTAKYVCPSSVSRYYWKKFMVSNTHRPLFPMGEINDVAAVFAGTKPAAIIDADNTNDTLQTLILMSQNYQVNHKTVNNKIIFSKTNPKEIEDALSNKDHYRLGILLGYPRKAVKVFMQNLNIVKTATSEKNFNTSYTNGLPIPDFIPSSDWFK